MSRRHSISHLVKYWGKILKRLSTLCIELINLIYLGKLILGHSKRVRVSKLSDDYRNNCERT